MSRSSGALLHRISRLINIKSRRIEVSTAFAISYAAVWAILTFQTFVLLGLLRTVHRRVAPEATGAGAPIFILHPREPIPVFTASDTAGREITNEDLRGIRTAMVFVSPTCHSCSVTLDELSALMWKV